MTLQETLEGRGRWLFQHRSHLPLMLAPVFLVALFTIGTVAADHLSWETVCLAVALLGQGIRCATVGFVPARTSGRNTASQVADALNTTGVYSLVRHPLYLSNGIVVLGVTLLFGCWWLSAIVMLAFWLYYERIMLAEEAFLRAHFGAAFTDWAERVPAFIPRMHGWEQPALPFSLRTVIKREYHGVVAILAAFAGLHYLADLVVEGRPVPDPDVVAYAALAAAIFCVCRYLKKRTHVLRVPGR